ncbi:MAG: cupin domain-containing protein [Gemmatimonadales bacterium]
MSGREATVPEAERGEGIHVLRGSGICRAWNGIRYKAGLSAENVGSKRLSMNVATVPPGAIAFAHIHVDFEVMLYILEGRVRHAFGEGLAKQIDNGPGDFIFIEPGVPHEVYNLSQTEPVVAVVARSDAGEWEHIVDYPSEHRPARGAESSS